MVFEKNQNKTNIQEKQLSTSRIKRNCLDLNISCNDLGDEIDTSRMSRNIYDVFIFSKKILEITNEMWLKVFSTTSQKEKLRERAVCYNVFNEENCVDLNVHYYSFTGELASYQKLYINSQTHDDYLDYVKNVFNSLDTFLFFSFNSLENTIEHLLIEVYMINKSKELNPFKLFRKKSVGSEVNMSILNYFKFLKQIVYRFKLVNAPFELTERKRIIEFKINKAFEKKLGYLRNQKSKFNNISDKNKTSVNKTSYIDFNYEPNAISSNDYINQNFKIIENDLSTKEINATAVIEPDFLRLDNVLQHNSSGKIHTSNIKEESLKAEIYYVIFGSIFVFIFAFIGYVFFVIRKHNAKIKEPRSKELI